MAQWPLEEFFTQIDRGGATGGKPFFLGDMRSQCRPQCAHCACSGPVASGKKFYTEVYSMDRGQIGPGWGGALAVQFPFFFLAAAILNVCVAPWQYNSLFFFLAAAILTLSHWALWPSGQMASGKKRPAIFFFGSLGNVPPSVCKRKKTKNFKKKMQKKSLAKQIL